MISQVQNSTKSPVQEEPVQQQRLYYLDWLRVLAVLGVFYAHTAEIFDTYYWHMRQAGHNVIWDALGPFGARWGITLFFILAGASAWFALRTRTSRQFIGERIKRLLIPFFVAFIVLAPIQAYFMALIRSSYNGNILQFFPHFFENIHISWDLTWMATYSYHLWFLAYLFAISMLALPLLLYLKREQGANSFRGWLHFVVDPLDFLCLSCPSRSCNFFCLRLSLIILAGLISAPGFLSLCTVSSSYLTLGSRLPFANKESIFYVS